MSLENLFSYGTLQSESVQVAIFGRVLSGQADALPGYRQTRVARLDKVAAGKPDYHLNAEFTGRDSDFVSGTRFEVTAAELQKADTYEAPANYKRVQVLLQSGEEAWAYLHHSE